MNILSKKLIVSLSLIYLVISGAGLSYVSLWGVPVDSVIIILLFGLLFRQKISSSKIHKSFHYFLYIKVLYLSLATCVSVYRGLDLFQNYFLIGSKWTNILTIIVFYKVMQAGILSDKKVIHAINASVLLTSIVAIFQYFGMSFAWEIRDILMPFNDYSQVTDRMVNVRSIGRPVGLCLTSISLGSILCSWFLLVMSVYIIKLRNDKKYFSPWHVVSILACSLAVLFSSNRSAVGGILVAIVIYILLIYNIINNKVKKFLIITLLLLASFPLTIQHFQSDKLAERYSLSQSIEGDERFSINKKFLDLVVEIFPGSGFSHYGKDLFGLEIGWHNQIMMIASELSVFGLLLFAILYINIWLNIFELARSKADSDFKLISMAAGITIVVSCTINSLFHNINFFHQNDLIQIIFVINIINYIKHKTDTKRLREFINA